MIYKEPIYIAIEGNIGAGKTSLVTQLASALGAKTLFETFENNPHLSNFYKNQDEYAFQTEVFFLQERVRQLKENELLLDGTQKQTVVADYFIGKSLIFGQTTLPETFKQSYNNLFFDLVTGLRTPDLLIHLHRPIDYLLKKIGERGRPYETTIAKDYLRCIDKSYLEYYQKQSQICVVWLNCGSYDFHLPHALQTFMKKVLHTHWSKGIQTVDL